MSLNNDLAGLKIDSGVTKSPFPAVTKNAVGNVGGTPTAVFSISFADKIMVTISQAGRLSQWVGPRIFIFNQSILLNNGIRSKLILYEDPGSSLITIAGEHGHSFTNRRR